MTVVTDHLSLADVGDLHEYVGAVAGVRDQVLVVAPVSEDLLAVGDALDGLELVTVARRILEVEPGGRSLHAVLELAHEKVGATLHEKRDLVDPSLVVLRGDPPLAWRR